MTPEEFRFKDTRKMNADTPQPTATPTPDPGEFTRQGITSEAADRCKALGLPLNANDPTGSAFLTVLAELEARKPLTPEQTHFQLLFTSYDGEMDDNGNQAMQRHGLPTLDVKASAEMAIHLLRRHDVREVFMVTVHSAFSKEVNIKKVF